MSNIPKIPMSMKTQLFQIAVKTLEAKGWKVERIVGSGKSSVRRITKGSESKKVTIRTSQDTWIGFNRNPSTNGWGTLDGIDMVVVVSVDDKDQPEFANVHFIDSGEIRDRFDRAYTARVSAGYIISPGSGVWISLYDKATSNPVILVGAGVGLDYPPIETILLSDRAQSPASNEIASTSRISPDELHLSIAEAKRRLAVTLGVLPDNIKIIVEA